ncbi:MAG TPA: TonB family protein [Gemmatimonadaceae bacterium]|jgi:TonB family protein
MRTDICAMASLSLMTMSIASTSAAQTVAGRVLDRQSKRPLREVTVVLLADTGKSSHAAVRATTDSLGIFYLNAPSPGVYQLLFATANDTLLSGYVALGQDEVAQREFLLDTHVAERAYFEFQVTRQVQPSPNNRPPRYPEALRSANIQGEVLVQFIVDTTGKPEMNTFKVLRSTHVAFLTAVRSAVPDYEFEPAMILDRKVPQVVQMPFHFCLNGGPNPFARPDTGRLWAAPPLRPGVCP